MHSPGFTDWLASLSVLQVSLGILALTFVRLFGVRWLAKRRPVTVASRAGKSAIELADSLLYASAIAFLLVKPLIAQPYYIPTGSMEPTIHGDNESQDHVWVDKLGYRFHTPTRGDVVVFYPPTTAGDSVSPTGQPQPFIKRLMGVPGDRLQVSAGKVIVNGQAYSHEDLRHFLAAAGYFGAGDQADLDPIEFRAVHHVKFATDGVYADGKLVEKPDLGRLLIGDPGADVSIQPGVVTRNGKVLTEPYIAEDPDYDLKLYKGKPLKENYGAMEGRQFELDGQLISKEMYSRLAELPTGSVPPRSFFMMGDNRNNSEDSTEWGPLASDRVVGKAEMIFWPINRVKLGL